MKKKVPLYNETGDIVILLYSVRRAGSRLIIEGKALGTIEMEVVLNPGEIFDCLKLALSWQVISFVLLLPYFGIKRLIHR